MVAFSDCSGQGGKIWIAAVLYRDGVEGRALRKHLGSEEMHTVFEAKCSACHWQLS